MRYHFHRLLIFYLIVYLAALPLSTLPFLKAAPLTNEEAVLAIKDRQRLVADILQIDTELALLRADRDKADSRLRELENDLEKMQKETNELTSAMCETEEIVGQWLRFLAEDGSLAYVEILLGASNLMDFLTRLDIVITIIDSNISSLEKLETQVNEIGLKQAEFQAQIKSIAETHLAINENLQQIESLRKNKTDALAEAEKTLADFPAVLALSQTWEQVLPDIDHCLDRLERLPWNTIDPDNVQIDYLRGKATVSFNVSTLESIINRGLRPSERFKLSCRPGLMLLERPGLNYILGFEIHPEKRRIIFQPISVTVDDTKIPDSALNLLFKDRNLGLDLPLVARLEIAEAQVLEGQVKIFLRRR